MGKELLEQKLTETLKASDKTLDPVVESAIKRMEDAEVAILLQESYKKLTDLEQRVADLEKK